MVRIGSFSGSLDPFGSGRGGLGRYNIGGETIASLTDFEKYATSVAWNNGAASDADMLAILQQQLAMAVSGSRDAVQAANELRDTEYNIARNKYVGDVNAAVTSDTRISALSALMSFEQGYLGMMTATDSETYREQAAKIASLRGEIRQERYSALVEKVNRGMASTERLFELAQQLYAESGGDPDLDDWVKQIEALKGRIRDEQTAQAYQDYQQGRIKGTDLLAILDAQLAELDPGSPAARELTRAREDLAVRVQAEAIDLRDAEVSGLRATGKMSDADYLVYLRDAYVAAPPGSAQALRAGTRLTEYTFSLSEDKLRYDVSKGTRPIGDLIRFYQGYLKTMNPGSDKYRAIESTISSLKKNAAGGNGGTSAPKGITLLAGTKPLIDGVAALADILHGQKPPPGFASLFKLDPTSSVSWGWWSNNYDSMKVAFDAGRTTWTYWDPAGRQHQVAFDPGMMSEFDILNIAYTQTGINLAESVKEVNTWVGRLQSATNKQYGNEGTYAKDGFDAKWATLVRLKERLLAAGKLAEYWTVTRKQAELIAATSANPFLTGDDRAALNDKAISINPQIGDPDSEFFLPNGDPVLAAFEPGGAIIAEFDTDGNILSAQLDPDKAHLEQGEGGVLKIVLVEGYRTDPTTDQPVPDYFDTHVQVMVRGPFGENVIVWQPISRPDRVKAATTGGKPQGMPVYTTTAGSPTLGGLRASLPLRAPDPLPLRAPDPTQPGTDAVIPVFEVLTYEHVNGKVIAIRWVTLSDPAGPPTPGTTWVRLGPEGVPGVLPRVVLPPNVTIGTDGLYYIDGKKQTSFDPVLGAARWWSSADTLGSGEQFGAPGLSFVTRKTDSLGRPFDARDERIIDLEEAVRFHYDPRITDVGENQIRPKTRAAHPVAQVPRRAGGPDRPGPRLPGGVPTAISNDAKYRRGGLLSIGAIPRLDMPVVFGRGPIVLRNLANAYPKPATLSGVPPAVLAPMLPATLAPAIAPLAINKTRAAVLNPTSFDLSAAEAAYIGKTAAKPTAATAPAVQQTYKTPSGGFQY